VALEHCVVKMQVYDTAGQDRFRSIAKHYYKNVAAVFVVYDITRRSTFEHVSNWLADVKVYAQPNIPIWIVGNKSDLGVNNHQARQVTTEEGERLAKSISAHFIETSAQHFTSTANLFHQVADHLARNWGWNQAYQPLTYVEVAEPRSKSWCCCN
jgi:small GTP-binding protein